MSVDSSRRRDRFLRLAEYHEDKCSISWACGKSSYSATNALGEDVRAWSSKRIAWHRRLGEKYRRAAKSPLASRLARSVGTKLIED